MEGHFTVRSQKLCFFWGGGSFCLVRTFQTFEAAALEARNVGGGTVLHTLSNGEIGVKGQKEKTGF